jgi:hypothetical protein
MVAYNFKDLQFCDDFDKLTSDSPEYVKYKGMRQGMEGSECAQCPSNLVGKCKCYNQVDKGTDTGTINEVMCAQEIDGVRYACPEKCCGTSGCTEPRRSDTNSVEAESIGIPVVTTGTSTGTSTVTITAPKGTSITEWPQWKIAIVAVSAILGLFMILGIMYMMFTQKKKK